MTWIREREWGLYVYLCQLMVTCDNVNKVDVSLRFLYRESGAPNSGNISVSCYCARQKGWAKAEVHSSNLLQLGIE